MYCPGGDGGGGGAEGRKAKYDISIGRGLERGAAAAERRAAGTLAYTGARCPGTRSYSQTMNNKTLIQTAIFDIKHSCPDTVVARKTIISYKSRWRRRYIIVYARIKTDVWK